MTSTQNRVGDLTRAMTAKHLAGAYPGRVTTTNPVPGNGRRGDWPSGPVTAGWRRRRTRGPWLARTRPLDAPHRRAAAYDRPGEPQ